MAFLVALIMTMYSTFIEKNAKQGYFLLPWAIELKSQVKKHSLMLIFDYRHLLFDWHNVKIQLIHLPPFNCSKSSTIIWCLWIDVWQHLGDLSLLENLLIRLITNDMCDLICVKTISLPIIFFYIWMMMAQAPRCWVLIWVSISWALQLHYK
jgi:hypothetical protein